MPEMKNTGSRRQGGSLLSIGAGDQHSQTRSTEHPSPRADARDPALRHRLARSRREARPNPLLHALAARPDPEKQAQSDIDDRFVASMDAQIEAEPDRATGDRGAPADPEPTPARGAAHGSSGYDYHRDEVRPLIDPARVVAGISRSKKLIAATTIIGALAGVMFALATPKKYESVAELLVDPRDIRIVDRELVNSDVSPNTAIAIVENQMRIMTSSLVVDRVVERLNLDTDPEFNGSMGGFRLPNPINMLRSILVRRDGGGGEDRSHAIAVQNLLENLDVDRGGKTFVVSVGVESQSAEKSALIANTLVDVFLENSSQFLSSTAGRAANELTAKLDQLRQGVEEAERKVEAYKGENDLIDARGVLIGDDEIIKLNEQLVVARARKIELNARAASARSADVESALGGALPEGINSPLITELLTQYAELQRRAEQSAIKFGAKHPENRAIQAQLQGARTQLRSELRRIITSIQVELKRAVQLEQQLSARLAALKARQVEVSDDLVTLRELERDAAAKRAVYESFLLRARETGEQQDLNPANISLISPATAPLDPKGPSRAAISIAGTLAGLLLGIGLGALRGAADGMFGGHSPDGRGRAPAPRRQPTPPAPPPTRTSRHEEGRQRAEIKSDDPPKKETSIDDEIAAIVKSVHAAADTPASADGPPQPASKPTGPDMPPHASQVPPAMPESVHAAAVPPAHAAHAAMPPYPTAYPVGHPSVAGYQPAYPVGVAPAPAYAPYGAMAPVAYPMAMPAFAAPVIQPTFIQQPIIPQAVPPGYYPAHAAHSAHHATAAPTPPPAAHQAPATPTPVPERPTAASEPPKPEHQSDPVDTLRGELRDVRSAIYDLAERRARRRA